MLGVSHSVGAIERDLEAIKLDNIKVRLSNFAFR